MLDPVSPGLARRDEAGIEPALARSVRSGGVGHDVLVNPHHRVADRHRDNDVLKIIATDPGSVRDFQAFARQTGNELLEQSSDADEFIHFLRRR